MADIIQLLSNHISNQIAAGEVIQRPASAVKELMENAIDAGATDIQLVIKNYGSDLIQVIDNGKGMSATDARMSFERHATSKISKVEDLFAIRTMGFRGEALASIAAVTQVELKTRQKDKDIGTRIVIEGTEVKLQEACVTNAGTNIMVKNLFFNVPARRKFLKSPGTELRNIQDEFTRIALAYPEIAFRFWHNGSELFHLDAGSIKTRIIALLGNHYDKKLVPVEEKTDLLNISGFIGKPEAAIRTRGMQFFFVNGRFIRNTYLNHAISTAFDGLIDKTAFPFYVLFFDVDPKHVDVNVHPTKQEVKFEDERMMYSFLLATVRHALARNNIAPSLDFTLNADIQHLASVEKPQTETDRANTQNGYLFNVFSDKNQAHVIERKDSLKQWKTLYEIAKSPISVSPEDANSQHLPLNNSQPSLINTADNSFSTNTGNMLMIHGTMLATTVKSGMMLIHIKRAQERIYYERLQRRYQNKNVPSQQLLFPTSFELAPSDALLLSDILADLSRIGFEISSLGKNTYVIQGVPMDMPAGEENNIINEILDNLKHESTDAFNQRTDKILINIARRVTRYSSNLYQPEEQQALIDELFACSQPEMSTDGKKVFIMIKQDELEKMLD